MPPILTRSVSLGAFSRLNKSHCVLMLGWAGADDKSLKKYSDLYEKRGLDTLRYISQMKAFSPKGLAGMRDMDEIFPLLDEIRDRRLVMHIFSMNGVFSLITLLHNKKYSSLFDRTDGIIWDSCPIKSKLIPSIVGYNQVMNNLHKKTLESGSMMDRLGFVAGKSVFLSSALLGELRQLYHVSTGGDISEVSPYYYLRKHPQLPHRHTFIYSLPDMLCPAPPIRAFHEYLSDKRDLEVDFNCFDDSDHVKHLPAHPKEYNENIDRMLTFVDRKYHPSSKM
ncbi:hypothetical protein PFISCL1PPCAC_19586 [Pristionchus fissidentatus]|uniref:Hydrolase n=1 Tax=Pristionchus fissidentatus TaxID=1538716 RepID=A0AAV5WC38_9BILA|nr:hypothetical protein PFISCL1PPCAC_19586 [Pristionchus fissidentatus]